MQLSQQTLAYFEGYSTHGNQSQGRQNIQLLRQKVPGLTTTFPCITCSVPKRQLFSPYGMKP